MRQEDLMQDLHIPARQYHHRHHLQTTMNQDLIHTTYIMEMAILEV